jgi:hypothetical protein
MAQVGSPKKKRMLKNILFLIFSSQIWLNWLMKQSPPWLHHKIEKKH